MLIATLDVETTGLCVQKDRIVEIAIILHDEKYNVVEKYHKYVNPMVLIPPETTRIHRVSDAMVRSAPTMKDIAKEVSDILDRATFISAFNGLRFDRSILIYELERVGVVNEATRKPWLDIYPIIVKDEYSYIFPSGNKKRRLVDLADALNMPIENAHSALEDTEGLVNVTRGLIDRGILPESIYDQFDIMLS